ncbi:L-lactate permease [Pigmentibacter ruber]|uniref:L-lactate permease n=1 Tax=Pigmentibacter ruber TaxID=2683196 RepID=UPI00131CAB6F|nr:L-lactate permease [Pigmentibacter ruber]
MIYFLIALSPFALCIFSIFILKRTATFSALLSCTFSIAIAILFPLFKFQDYLLYSAFFSSVILTSTIAIIIIPGLYFNNLLKKMGNIDKISSLIENLPLSSEKKTLILLLGILPAIESFTGFGISLLIGIPIFFRLYIPQKAFFLSMLSLNTIPWGTLAISTVVSSSLSGYSISAVGLKSAIISFLVFPIVGCVSLYVVNGVHLLRKKWYLAFTHGFVYALLLIYFNYLKLTELSGILTGIVSCLIFFAIYYNLSSKKQEIKKFFINFIKLLYPYFVLLAFIVLIRIQSINKFLHDICSIKWKSIELNPFVSPGIALTMTTIIFLLKYKKKLDHKQEWKKIKNVLLSLFLFILLARFMLEFRIIGVITEQISNIETNFLKLLILPLIGMLSGFIAGSNVGGNVLALTIQMDIGNSFNQGLLFVAGQNSAAGHIVFTSLPIIVLIITLASDYHSSSSLEIRKLENTMLKFGMKVSFLYLISFFFTIFISYIFIK